MFAKNVAALAYEDIYDLVMVRNEREGHRLNIHVFNRDSELEFIFLVENSQNGLIPVESMQIQHIR